MSGSKLNRNECNEGKFNTHVKELKKYIPSRSLSILYRSCYSNGECTQKVKYKIRESNTLEVNQHKSHIINKEFSVELRPGGSFNWTHRVGTKQLNFMRSKAQTESM